MAAISRITSFICAFQNCYKILLKNNFALHCLPWQRPPAPLGGTQDVTRPEDMCNPSSAFWVCPGVLYQLDVPRTPSEGGVLEEVPQPPQLAQFNMKEQWLYSKLSPDLQASHAFWLSSSSQQQSSPVHENHKQNP